MSSLYFDLPSDESRYLEQKGISLSNCAHAEPLTSVVQLKSAAGDVDVLSVFIHSRITADIMDALPELRLITTRSTGFDHIDLDAAAKRGIVVCNVPTYGENTVAEHTFALILTLSRNIQKASMRTSQCDFSRAGLDSFDLKGRTIGIVGTGHIGLHVAKIARGFRMEVCAFDPSPQFDMAESLGFEYTSFHDLLQRSDIVTLHAPLTLKTRRLMNCGTLSRMKPGAVLINTARGELVDTQDLIAALDSGRLSAAGLDVLEGETNLSEENLLHVSATADRRSLQSTVLNFALLRRSDLVVTPHIAFDSREAVERILDTTRRNIEAFREGTPINVLANPLFAVAHQ